jgi:hypothetical protein
MAVAECGIREIWPNIMVKKAPPPDSKEWEGSRANSNTSRQMPARVIEADSARAATFTFAVCQPWCGRRLTRGASNMTEVLASKTCAPCRGGIPPLTREQAELFHAQAPDWQLAADAHRIGGELPVSQFPLGAYPPSKDLRINSRLRSLRRILR